ncbi:MAG: hypothetical protein L6R42_000404 [Xanthoria sp. 1 TBL-2021]|nr:MAG: hypothetical protein L6R42_000404 [Xanthoria sp. 1 TBL-2021]
MSNDQDRQPPASGSHELRVTNPERKIQLHEYRIAARREKRLRKADEKKQRKLNATILRRMTRNPDKYNKNAERNRLRDIEAERARIQTAAIKQIQQLAAVHDPSGVTFNIGPVVRKNDGSVVSAESTSGEQTRDIQSEQESHLAEHRLKSKPPGSPHEVKLNLHPGRMSQIEDRPVQPQKSPGLQPYPHPRSPKPRIPAGISLPDGEQDWLALWDLPDAEIERRIMRLKKGKAAERKALRVAQQSGKSEPREARDEKRKIYRDIKLIWKVIREQHVKERTMLKAVEDEESRKIAVEVNEAERRTALSLCEFLGFTVSNTPGTEDIKPRALGMRGREVDFAAIQAGKRQGDVEARKDKRVNLGQIAKSGNETYVTADQVRRSEGSETFIKLDVGEGQDHEALNLNNKLRRKLRRALDNAQIQKELLVRQRTIDHLKARGIALPNELKTDGKARNIKGVRILENGATETAKQERVRARVDLAEFNNASKVLRRQAKQCAIEAGLRKHAALTGRLSPGNRVTSTENAPQPPYIKASAVQAQVIAAAAERGKFKTQRSVERAEDPTGESNDVSDSDNLVKVRRSAKRRKLSSM